MNNLIEKSKKGFTLLFASLVASLLLGVGLGIFSIVFKQIALSSSNRESARAFYAADAASECALFHDFKSGNFATSSESSPPDTLFCDGEDITATWNIVSGSDSAVTTFNLSGSGSYCATVVVSKNSDGTTVDSRGYNTCDTTNIKRVERGIRVSY